MAVTRSSAAERTRTGIGPLRANAWPVAYFFWLLAAALLVTAGLYLVYEAKALQFAAVEKGLAAKQILNLNELSAREDLLPVLTLFPDPAERQFVARKIYYISGNLPNVGALARIRVTPDELRRARIRGMHGHTLLTEQFRALKPRFVVRRPQRSGAACCSGADWRCSRFWLSRCGGVRVASRATVRC